MSEKDKREARSFAPRIRNRDVEEVGESAWGVLLCLAACLIGTCA